MSTWDVSRDGQRFLQIVPDAQEGVDTASVVVVTGWFEKLKKLAPAP